MATFSGPCDIRRAGIRSGTVAQLDLKAGNGQFGYTWFLSDPDLGREMLAIALGALLANKQVDATIELPDPPAEVSWAKVTSLFLI